MKKFNLKKFAADFLLVCGMISALCTTFIQVKNTFFKEEVITKNQSAVISEPLDIILDEQQATQSFQPEASLDYNLLILGVSVIGAGAGFVIKKKLAKKDQV